MDDRQLLTPVSESDGRFKPLKTTPILTIYFVALLALEIMAIVYAILHPDIHNKCREYFLLIYMHVAFWFLTLVFCLLILILQFLICVPFSWWIGSLRRNTSSYGCLVILIFTIAHYCITNCLYILLVYGMLLYYLYKV